MGFIKMALLPRAHRMLWVCGLFVLFHVVAAAQTAPVLIVQPNTTRAVALESITHRKEPFSLTSSVRFGSDARTRITVFAWNAQLNPGEGLSAYSADVQDASGRFYPLTVENAVALPAASGITMLVLRLNDGLGNVGDVLLRVSLRGLQSNRVRIGIGHVGGGPPDDSPSPSPTPTPTPTPTPAPTPPPSTTSRLKVLHWNVAYGRGTDNIIDLDRQVNWMVNMQADLISLNEVPPDNTSIYVNLLQQKTGVTWYSHWVAITPGNNVGQQILSRYPLLSTGSLYMSFGRSVTQVTANVGGKAVNFFSTHLSFESSSWRFAQLDEINNWFSGFAEPRIVAGDFNLWDGLAEYGNITANHYDSWKQAKNAGTAVAYADNPEGKTRGGRIDYVFYSKSASNLTLIEARVPDQRDLNNRNVAITVGNSSDWGVRPSDHNLLVSTFELR